MGTINPGIDPVSILLAAQTVRPDALLFEGQDLCGYSGWDPSDDPTGKCRALAAYTGGSLDLRSPGRAPRYSSVGANFFIILIQDDLPGAATFTDAEAALICSKVGPLVGAGIKWWIEQSTRY